MPTPHVCFVSKINFIPFPLHWNPSSHSHMKVNFLHQRRRIGFPKGWKLNFKKWTIYKKVVIHSHYSYTLDIHSRKMAVVGIPSKKPSSWILYTYYCHYNFTVPLCKKKDAKLDCIILEYTSYLSWEYWSMSASKSKWKSFLKNSFSFKKVMFKHPTNSSTSPFFSYLVQSRTLISSKNIKRRHWLRLSSY